MALYRHFIKIFLLAILAVHVGIHALYLAPINPATNIYAQSVNVYMTSFFSQNWHLFAPEPAVAALSLEYRCSPEEPWNDSLANLYKEHKAFPFTSKGKQTYVYGNIARELFNAKVKNAAEMDVPELNSAKELLQRRCSQGHQAELRVRRLYTQDYSRRFQRKYETNPEQYVFHFQTGDVAWK
ncbi:DUF5819 family protein [Bdellovibrio sp. HCB2-146]|uniref:DUF5819 family protein n=1 Tax=Bdellovibrio sp. HCB2-146 TaxID=3394362 RepID=UPI0039BCE0AA